ncbi:MAG: Dioxygenase [uncultured bacterium]|nr:MAG: Dioxygenase [uncultured bacterium]OGH13153.1 MAG: hypothetical protein A2687_05185 [Candidatus Levybacteria bacterium RIFCSPHIGHO2_01_FULL_38_26]
MKNKSLIYVFVAIFIVGGVYFILGRQTSIAPTHQTQESASVTSAPAQPDSTDCTENPTPSQTEGPYYKSGSPLRNNIAEGISGEILIITGYIYDKNCNPISNAWLDFWQADSNGVYDNARYRLRGHQFADEKGMYRLETIVPAQYGSRPAHIHVKVMPPNGPILTSQIYFPNDPKNQTDSIFNQELIMTVEASENVMQAEFNFVLNQ